MNVIKAQRYNNVKAEDTQKDTEEIRRPNLTVNEKRIDLFFLKLFQSFLTYENGMTELYISSVVLTFDKFPHDWFRTLKRCLCNILFLN